MSGTRIQSSHRYMTISIVVSKGQILWNIHAAEKEAMYSHDFLVIYHAVKGNELM
jgi:ABC-type uncharacterized transport system ATPase component